MKPIYLSVLIVMAFCAPGLSENDMSPRSARSLFNAPIELNYRAAMDAYREGRALPAIRYMERAVQSLRLHPGMEDNLASCLVNLGCFQVDAGLYAEAHESFEEALGVYQKLGIKGKVVALCSKNMAEALLRAWKLEESLKQHREALALLESTEGTHLEQAWCRLNIGVIQYAMGDNAEARETYKEAIDRLTSALPSKQELVDALTGLADEMLDCERHSAATACYGAAIDNWGGGALSRKQKARCRLKMGDCLKGSNRPEEAIAAYELALTELSSLPGSERQRAVCLERCGQVLYELGQYDMASERFSAGIAVLNESDSLVDLRCTGLLNISRCLCRKGQYGEALKMLSLVDDLAGVASAASWSSFPSRRQQTMAASFLLSAEAFLAIREFESARKNADYALTMYSRLPGGEAAKAFCRVLKAEALTGLGRHDEAIHIYDQVVEMKRRNWRMFLGFSRAYRGSKRLKSRHSALLLLRLAIELAEEKRGSVDDFEFRSGVFGEPSEVYTELASLLLEYHLQGASLQDTHLMKANQLPVCEWGEGMPDGQELAAAAFSFADRGKARSVADAIARIDSKGAGAQAMPTVQKTNVIRESLPSDTAILQYVCGHGANWLLVLSREGITTHKLPVALPGLPELFRNQKASLSQLLDAWKTRRSELGLEGLVTLARARVEDLGRRKEERTNLVEAEMESLILEHLGKLLLPPAALATLHRRKITHIILVPDGPLHLLPFSMLMIPGNRGSKYLVEQWSVSYAPSIATLLLLEQRGAQRDEESQRPRRDFLAFADPDFGLGTTVSEVEDEMRTRAIRVGRQIYALDELDLHELPKTRREAMRVASLFGEPLQLRSPVAEPRGRSVVYLRQAACESTVKRLLNTENGNLPWRYVLFATHGLADRHQGLWSCLVMARPGRASLEDGLLQARELLGLELYTDLVMLSACQTGLGRQMRGEGITGLSTAFFIAGAESLCCSLWNVPTGPTAELSAEFFRNMQSGGMDRAEALRRAQIHLIKKGSSGDAASRHLAEPFSWGAFVLSGLRR